MAKDITVKLKFDSNGDVVMSKLTVSAKELQSAVSRATKGMNDSFE